MIGRLKSLGAFWYDFLIGEDWRVAVGVVVALGVTRLVAGRGIAAWWILPVAVVIFLWMTVRRAAKQAGSSRTPRDI